MILMREELINVGITNLARDEQLAEETVVTLDVLYLLFRLRFRSRLKLFEKKQLKTFHMNINLCYMWYLYSIIQCDL